MDESIREMGYDIKEGRGKTSHEPSVLCIGRERIVTVGWKILVKYIASHISFTIFLYDHRSIDDVPDYRYDHVCIM